MSIQPTQYAGIAAVLNPTPDTLDRTYAWGMASTVSHLTLSGFAPTLDDALFQAFSSAITAHPLDFLMVYCPDESFAGRLAEFNPYTNVRIAEWTINSHAGQLAKAGRYLAQDLLTEVNGPEVCPVVNLRGDTASLAPLTIATDGSHGRASSAWAWVSSDGHYRSGAGKSLNPLSAEVLAIREALKAAPKFRPVILLSDSKWAISHARRVQQDPQCAALLECKGLSTAVLSTTQSLIRERSNVTYQWVRGHAGNPMNEAADRLAVHTRRCHEAGLAVIGDVVAQIVEDMMASTAAPLQMAS